MSLTRPDVTQVTKGDASLDTHLHHRGQTSDPYFRSIAATIPFKNAHTTYLAGLYGVSEEVFYPQSMAFDDQTGEMFMLRNGPNDWAWISVYDMNDGWSLKRTFTTGRGWGESLVIRYDGATRYLYTVEGSVGVIRADITVLPVNYSTVTVTSLGIPAYTQMAFDGNTWAVQSPEPYKGTARRGRFDLWDLEFANKIGEVNFPIGQNGDLGAYSELMNKAQSVCFHNGQYVFGCGGDWVTGIHDPDDAYLHHGMKVCGPGGECVAAGLTRPDKLLEIFNQHLPFTGEMLEIEAVNTYKGDVYALWMTVRHVIAILPGHESEGIVITKEFSTDRDAIDCRPAARVIPSFNGNRLQSDIVQSTTQIIDPVTRATLDSFADICGMMKNTGLSTYRFFSSGQTIVDINNVAVDLGSSLVEFHNLNGSSYFVEVTSLTQSQNRAWWIYNNFTQQAELVNARKWLIAGGTGSPEGVVTAGKGTIYTRTDGGAGTTMYVKESGTGNTGWVAK